MARTLEIPAELERALQEKAGRLGLPVESYVIEVLRHETEQNGASAQDKHRQRVQALRGKYKKSGSMVDELLQERRAEVARDEAESTAASVQDERSRLLKELRGCMAHVPGTVDDFLRERREETENEDRKVMS